MKKNRVHGTPEQFEAALKNKIQELGGDVEACSNITASSETTYIDDNGVMGEDGCTWTVSELREYWDAEHLNDPVLSEYDSFDSWLEDTLSFMSPVDASTDITGSVDNDRYIHTLIGDIQSEFQGRLDSMKFDSTDDSLIITAVLGNEVKEFSVPYSDLKFDWNNIDEDTQYISNEIDEEFNREYVDDVISESSVNSRSSKFGKVLGSANYYDYPKYSKTLYLPSIRQGKVKLTIGTFSDPHYDDDNTFEILAVVDVESRRYDFTLDSRKLCKKLNIDDGHEKLSGYDDEYDNIEDTVDEIYEYFISLDQDDIDDTLIELADDFDVNRVKQMFGPLTASSQLTKVQSSDDTDYNDYVDYTQFIEPVKRKLASVGVDVNSPEADDYADAAAELIAQDDDHDVEYWWKETKSDPMYMDEVDALPHV